MTSRRSTITRYYDACNTGDIAGFEETLDADVVHYFLAPNVGSAPVASRERLIGYWRKVQPMIDGRWVVDHVVESGNEAVIEWSLFWTPPHGVRVVTRGSEWFVFSADDQITEIRSYYQQRDGDTDLESFDYAGAGYSRHGAESSRLHGS